MHDTLKHPNWVMGQKITVDSATLVNKGLEVMEARWLFDVDLDHIQVVVQPQSVIHSMVEFKDGADYCAAWNSGYASANPVCAYIIRTEDTSEGDRLDFAELRQITFEEPDMETFLGLPMAMQASQRRRHDAYGL